MPKKKKHRGKAKGNAFEALIVRQIRKAVSKKFSEDVVYRTPGSGGHYIIGGSDIMLKKKLRTIFNFAVECKHQKTIKIESLFDETEQMKKFLAQTLENTFEKGDHPLLVMRGNRTGIYCATTLATLTSTGYDALTTHDTPGLLFKFRGKSWKLFLFKFMMEELKNKVKELD